MDKLKDEWLKRIDEVYKALLLLIGRLGEFDWGASEKEVNRLIEKHGSRKEDFEKVKEELVRWRKECPDWAARREQWLPASTVYEANGKFVTAVKELEDFEKEHQLSPGVAFTSPEVGDIRYLEDVKTWFEKYSPEEQKMFKGLEKPKPGTLFIHNRLIWPVWFLMRARNCFASEMRARYKEIIREVSAICKARQEEATETGEKFTIPSPQGYKTVILKKGPYSARDIIDLCKKHGIQMSKSPFYRYSNGEIPSFPKPTDPKAKVNRRWSNEAVKQILPLIEKHKRKLRERIQVPVKVRKRHKKAKKKQF